MPIRTDPTPRPVAAALVAVPASSSERPAGSVAPSAHAAPSLPAGRSVARPAPRRPDPTITRLAVAAGGIATISALLAAIASAAIPTGTAAAAPTTGTAATPGSVQTIVKYVYVQPGQVNPGTGLATVVTPPAPLQAPAPVVTRQSGAKP